MSHEKNDNTAFSLVELSIVLVILGLLTGGILGGRSLIKAARLHGITSELSQYRVASNAFQLKYGSQPGDFGDATHIWREAPTCPTPQGGAALGNRTCDGNENGHIGGDETGEQPQEAFLFWQHLALGGFINGEFSGVAGAAGRSDHIILTNAPASRYPNGGWSAYYFPDEDGSTNQYALSYGNTLIFGAQRTPYTTNGKLLLPEEAWSIDKKVDDGHPTQGNVGAHWLVDDCTSADNGVSDEFNLQAHYRLEDASPQCSLYFREVL